MSQEHYRDIKIGEAFSLAFDLTDINNFAATVSGLTEASDGYYAQLIAPGATTGTDVKSNTLTELVDSAAAGLGRYQIDGISWAAAGRYQLLVGATGCVRATVVIDVVANTQADIYAKVSDIAGAVWNAVIASYKGTTGSFGKLWDAVMPASTIAIPGDKMDLMDTPNATAIQTIWNTLTSAISWTAGSFGKLFVDILNAAISSRMATFTYTAPDNDDIEAIAAMLPSVGPLAAQSDIEDLNDLDKQGVAEAMADRHLGALTIEDDSVMGQLKTAISAAGLTENQADQLLKIYQKMGFDAAHPVTFEDDEISTDEWSLAVSDSIPSTTISRVIE